MVENDKMIVWLNGTEMVSLVDPKLATEEGKIAFQIHKGDTTELEWKNVTISEM